MLGEAGGAAVACSLGLVEGASAAAARLADSRLAALLVLDGTLQGSAAAATLAAAAGIPVATFKADFGTAWLAHLEPLWRRGPLPVIGATYGGSYFCADQLARDHGLACAYRSANMPAGIGPTLARAIAALHDPGRPPGPVASDANIRPDRPLVWAFAARAAR